MTCSKQKKRIAKMLEMRNSPTNASEEIIINQATQSQTLNDTPQYQIPICRHIKSPLFDTKCNN
jgi:hypothetical protein